MNIITIHYSFLYTEYIYIQMLEEKALIMMVHTAIRNLGLFLSIAIALTTAATAYKRKIRYMPVGLIALYSAALLVIGLGMWINYGFQQDLQNNIFALEQQESGMKGVINYDHWLTTARAFWVAQFLVLAVLLVSLYSRRDAFGKSGIIGSSGLS